jgi:hypothetical protein
MARIDVVSCFAGVGVAFLTSGVGLALVAGSGMCVPGIPGM